MNRKKPRTRKEAKVGGTARRASFPRRIGWIAVGFLVAIAFGLWLWKQSPSPTIPRLDLTHLDEPVARIIQTHLDQVQAQPRSAAAWGNLGKLLWSYNVFEPARHCLAEAQRLDPREPRWPYFLSLSLSTEAPAQALVHLRRAVQLCGNEPEAPRLRLSSLLAEDGKWEEASRELQKLLEAKPDFTPALLLQARHAQSRGNLTEAVNLARRCAEDPRTVRAATILLAGLAARQGDSTSAATLSRRLATLPNDEPVADPYQAEAAALRSDPRALTEQTHPLLAAGRLEQAEPIVDRLLKEHPGYAETWLLAGRLQFLKKDLAGAERSLKRHLELDPSSSQGWFQLGLVQLAQERFSTAAETFLHATRLKPGFGPAFYNRGFALARSGDLRTAQPAFQEAIRLNPERIDSYLMAADIALRLGDSKESAQLLQQAEALNATHPGVRQLKEKLRRANASGF